MLGDARPALRGQDRAPEKIPRGSGAHSLAGVGLSRNPAVFRCAGCGARVPWWRRLCETCAGWMRVYSRNRKTARAFAKLARSGS